MTENNIYYRPVWTCGRYDDKAQVAIFYNLIAGMSYFFESYSAMVIGKVLSVPRNGLINLDSVASDLNIAMESLAPFFQQLEQMGIVSSVLPTDEIIADYRKRVSEYNCQLEQTVERTTQEKLPYTISNAEQMYTEKVGGITSVMLELTYRCSEKCIHCYNEGATRNDDEICTRGEREELTFDDYKHIIDDLYEQGLIKVCMTGGDPFSKSFAWELIDYLYNKGIAFDVFTNGQNVVNDVVRLANYFPRLIGVSIYSIKGSWDKSMAFIRHLSSLGVPMNIKCCVMRPNVKSYYMVADIAKQFGASPQFEINLTDSIEGDKCVSKYLRMTKEQLEIVLRDDNISLYVGEEAPNYGGQSKPKDQNPCGAGENSLCITPEGNVIPCCAFHTLFGNLKDYTISSILKNSKELSYWRGLTLNDYEECGRYDYCAYCNLCPGNNFIEHGTPLKASEVNCFMAKTRYELAQNLMKGFDPLNGKTIRERLAELPDYVPMKIQKEMSLNDYSDTKLKVGG